MPKPRIVILLSRFPYPLEKGDKLRAYHQIKYLAVQFDICLIALSTIQVKAEDIKILEPFCTAIHILQLSKSKCAIRAGLALFSNTPFQVAYYYQQSIQQKISKIVEAYQPSLVYVQLARIAKYAANLNCKKVLDFQDAFSINYQRSSVHAKFPYQNIYQTEAKRILQFEKNIAAQFDAVTIISESDRQALDIKDIVVVPNGVDVNYFSPKDKQKKYDLVFIGNLGYMPNVLAVELIVKEIMPILIAKNNAIQLLIAGANPSAQMMAYSNNNIAVKAWVPDIRDAYADAKIFIAPLHTGAGLQNKLLEAMSMQMPCITTSICNNALHAIENKEILTANTTHEFVEKINTLLQNTELQTQLGSNARQMIIRKFDWASANSILIDLLTSVINKQK